MIPWIIALFLSLVAGAFSPALPSDQVGDPSDAAALSQVGDDAKVAGRSITTPVKLPTISWDLPVPMRLVACLPRVEHGDANWFGQFAFRQERGRAPPMFAAS